MPEPSAKRGSSGIFSAAGGVGASITHGKTRNQNNKYRERQL